jgi:hypothetical protein
VLSENGGGVKGILLGELGLDLLDDGGQVGDILLRLGPLSLGQELVLVRALCGAADAVDTVVGLLGAETLEGELDSLTLLLEEIIVSIVRR